MSSQLAAYLSQTTLSTHENDGNSASSDEASEDGATVVTISVVVVVVAIVVGALQIPHVSGHF